MPGAEEPDGVVAGRDGFIWYTGFVPVSSDNNTPAVSRLDPQTGNIKRYFLPLQAPPGTFLDQFTLGRIVQTPNGDLWFTVEYLSKGPTFNDLSALVQLDPHTGIFRSTLLPNIPHVDTFESENPNGAAEDKQPLLLPTANGSIWVLRTLLPTQLSGDSYQTRLYSVSPFGQVTVMSAPDHGLIEGVTLAPDNTLWAVYSASYHWPLLPIVTQENRLTRVSPGGVFTPLRKLPGGDITNIAIGPDSQLWIAVDDHPGVEIEKMALPR